MKRISILIICLMPLLILAQRQDSTTRIRLKLPKTPRQYYTQKNHQRLLILDKEMARRRAFIDHAANTAGPLQEDVTIAVVVHILYKAGSDTRSLPTEADVKQQLDIVSKDFRQTVKQIKHPADTKEKFSEVNALDTRISFCLAAVDPSGRTTNGVLTIPTSVTTWTADDKMKSAATGGSTAWDTEKYLNIWVVSLPDSISAYAQMPGGPAATDGIVIDARYFGKKSNAAKDFPYTEGETLTHLVGSYLNLYELWSETVRCGDDGVDDTPIHNAPNYGCAEYKRLSTCDGNPVAMTMNFMDNTNDQCSYMFTIGQKKRLQAALIPGGIRRKLVESAATLCKKNNLAEAIERNDNQPVAAQKLKDFTYRIYPNPARDLINLEIGLEKGGNAELAVFNAQGAVLTSQKYNLSEGNQVFSVNSSNWSAGLYFVRLKVNDNVVTERVMIHK